MPARKDANRRNESWSPTADYQRNWYPGHTADVVQFDDIEAVALELRENDPQLEALEWCGDVDVADLAREAATELIMKRRALLAKRLGESSAAGQEDPESVTTYNVPSVTDIRTGQRLIPRIQPTKRSRSFG